MNVTRGHSLPIEADFQRTAAVTDRWGLRALAIYSAVSLLLFGVPLIGHFRDAYLSQGNDPAVFSWLLIWWPHAIRHGLNAFFTRTVWEPSGFNLTWSTSVPLPALIAAPLTYTLGSIAAFNTLSLIASPLAGWAAFLFYRFLVKSWWPSLIGGYVFGFSAYICGQQVSGHIVLTLVFLVPLATLVVARGMAGDLSPLKLMVILTGILVGQALISLEVFATLTLAGFIALFFGWTFAPPAERARIRKVLPAIVGAYALAAIVLSPYLFAFFAWKPSGSGGMWPAYSVDLLNFVFPVPSTALGTIGWVDRLTMPFRDGGSIAEMDGYIGLPIILIAVLYVRRRFREPLGRALTDFLILFLVLSLGPRLLVYGVPTIGLPFKGLAVLPLLDKALPGRLMLYSFLALGLITALWLESVQMGIRAKVAIAAAIVLSTLPTPSGRWTTHADSPAFFTRGTYRHYLSPADNVLALPFGFRGPSMLWHGEAMMSFNLVGGYTGPMTQEFRAYPIAGALVNSAYMPDAVEQMAACLAHYNATAAVVSQADPDAASWDRILTPLSSDRQRVDGINYYRLSPSALAAYRGVTALEMARREAQTSFESLVVAADSWRMLGRDPVELTPARAVQHGWLQDSWFIGPNTIPGWSTGGPDAVMSTTMHLRGGAWLGGTPSGDFGVGLHGSYAALEPVIAKYRAAASHIYFPFPNDLLSPGATAPAGKTEALLTLVFDKEQLARAASSLGTRNPRENALVTVHELNR